MAQTRSLFQSQRWRKLAKSLSTGQACAFQLPGCSGMADCAVHVEGPFDEPHFFDERNIAPACLQCKIRRNMEPRRLGRLTAEQLEAERAGRQAELDRRRGNSRRW